MRDRDNQQRFLVETCDVRGQLVQLDDTWHDAIARTDYPSTVKHVLGEAFAAATLLAGTIKFDGKMTLQVRGNGPIHLLVVQVTNEGSVRGLARWQDEPADRNLMSAFGENARMIITIEAREYAEPYQGIVPLEGDCLADALQTYFRTSEQMPTRLHLAVSDSTVAGLLIQKLPVTERQAEDADGWQRAQILAATLSAKELCEKDVAALLHSVFHEERVRVFNAQPVRFKCSCSRERTDGMLTGLGREEVDSILEEQGQVEITCEFCDQQYRYDAVDIAAIFKGLGTAGTGDIGDSNDTNMVRH